MNAPATPEATSRRHLRVGFGALALFVSLGLFLEVLHGLKSPLYLDVGNETRRLVWRLAHAHGTLLAILNVVFALVVDRRPEVATPLASRGLLAATALVPFGFFAGGIVVRGGDPGLPVLLVPLGALSLVAALTSIVRALR